MTKLYSSDIALAKASDARKKVIDDAEDAEKLKQKIQAFIEESKSNEKLIGDTWDLFRQRLTTCCDALEQRKQASIALAAAIDNANLILENYMAGYDELDDSELPSLRAQLANAKNELARLERGTIPVTDKNGNIIRYDRDEAAIASVKAQIAELEKFIKKLEELKPTDNSALAVLNSFDLSPYQNAVNNLKAM